MADQLYHTDSELREMDAVVVAVEGDRVALDRTVFYARSGGQVADQGRLSWAGGSAAVIEVRKDGHQNWHQLDGPPPAVGTAVHGELDWARRHALMRTHTATHILNGVIWRDYGALVTGASVEPGRGRLDFELEHMSGEFAAEIEARINAEVAADRPVLVRFLPHDEVFNTPGLVRSKSVAPPEDGDEVRVVEIVGLDMQADGGTHVARTREVGTIRVVGHQSKGRNNKRLRIALDE